jgi:hypothetical protein
MSDNVIRPRCWHSEMGPDTDTTFGTKPYTPSEANDENLTRLLATMFTTEQLARRLDINQFAVNRLRSELQILGIKCRRQWYHPAEQLDGSRVIRDIDMFVRHVGHGWKSYRILVGQHSPLDNLTGRRALVVGRVRDLIQLVDSGGMDSFD